MRLFASVCWFLGGLILLGLGASDLEKQNLVGAAVCLGAGAWELVVSAVLMVKEFSNDRA